MKNSITLTKKVFLPALFFLALGSQVMRGQESVADFNSNMAYHNQLFFNRFLINPTFSLVRENKSYINILHRNQYATFEDNNQNYFLGFSNRLNDHTALGISFYSQWAGVIQEYGFNANYATAIQLGSKSSLTFGTNVTYTSEGLDKNRVVAAEGDPEILESKTENKVAIQPGITLSLGNFDFGLYAQNMFKYNQTTNNFYTNFSDKSLKASVQYTHSFMATSGLFANARVMPLMQLMKNDDGSLAYAGSILLDLPEYGWLQTSMDATYGMSLGLGFNINRKLSLGYLLEKNFLESEADLGWNHELSLAYTFKGGHPSDFGGYVDSSSDQKIDKIIKNYEEQILRLTAENNNPMEKTDSGSLAYQNRLILDELMLRQDSLEQARNDQFEKKFEMIVRILRTDIEQRIKYNSKENSGSQNTALATNDLEADTQKEMAVPMRKTYEKLPLKVESLSDIIGVNSGYYVIANVYRNKRYLNAFMKELKDQGLNAKQFYNKNNGLYYVYLADYNMKEEADVALVSNLDGKYQKEKWIMQINNTQATADIMYENP